MLTEKKIPNGDWNVVIGFPEIDLPSGYIRLWYSDHAKDEMIKEKLGIIHNPPRSISIEQDRIFEITTSNGQIWKFGIRIPYTETDGRYFRDLCLIISWSQDRGEVITVWTNYKQDTYRNLRNKTYLDPKNLGLPNRTMSARNRKLLKRAKHTAKYSGEPIVFNQDHRKKKT